MISDRFVKVVSGKGFRHAWTGFVILFFIVLVIIPTVFVLSYLVTDPGEIADVMRDGEVMSQALDAVGSSFLIAAIVTVIDFFAGLPVAWMLARKEFRGKRLLDTLIDMPLAVPTAALGFSAAIFWASTDAPAPYSMASLNLGIGSPMLLIILLHVVFSYPYMVRSLAAILEEIDETYDTAALTLGASRLTAARTVTLPLFRAGLATGVILCFARSMSETGGTMIALSTMGSSFNTGPTLIGLWKSDPSMTAALAMVSILLIILSLALLALLKLTIMKAHLPLRKVWPGTERMLSGRGFVRAKDGSAMLFLLLIVLVPSFFIFSYVMGAGDSVTDWGPFVDSLMFSFGLAAAVTVIDLLMGIPFALHISKRPDLASSRVLDVLVNVPLIVPTAALGISLGMFWDRIGLPSGMSFAVLVMAHVAFTYPLVVRNVAGAVEAIDPSFEETARTLGAKPIQTFRRVLYPLIKGSVLAGAIMAFTRSLGETGSTLAILGSGAGTVPVLIVNLVNSGQLQQAAASCVVLIIISYIAMLAMRYVARQEAA